MRASAADITSGVTFRTSYRTLGTIHIWASGPHLSPYKNWVLHNLDSPDVGNREAIRSSPSPLRIQNSYSGPNVHANFRTFLTLENPFVRVTYNFFYQKQP